jgi:hypothetical protein
MQRRTMPDDSPVIAQAPRSLRTLFAWLVVLGGALLGAAFLFGTVITMLLRPWFIEAMKPHLGAAIGVPLSAIVAFIMVTVFEVKSGPIEFEALGLKFRGASGPIILWSFVF